MKPPIAAAVLEVPHSLDLLTACLASFIAIVVPTTASDNAAIPATTLLFNKLVILIGLLPVIPLAPIAELIAIWFNKPIIVVILPGIFTSISIIATA